MLTGMARKQNVMDALANDLIAVGARLSQLRAGDGCAVKLERLGLLSPEDRRRIDNGIEMLRLQELQHARKLDFSTLPQAKG